jgi:hypothetical protein
MAIMIFDPAGMWTPPTVASLLVTTSIASRGPAEKTAPPADAPI